MNHVLKGVNSTYATVMLNIWQCFLFATWEPLNSMTVGRSCKKSNQSYL